MMNRNLLGIYSLAILLLLGIGLYRSATGPDQGPPPNVEIEMPREGANPGAMREPRGQGPKRTDFDGDDPSPTAYSFFNELGENPYLYQTELMDELSNSDYLMSPSYPGIFKIEAGKDENLDLNR